MNTTIDILMVTYESPRYVEMSLPRLLEDCPTGARVWVWHNGNDAETLSVVLRFADTGELYRFHHSPENQRLWAPTNWLWESSEADYLSKVDDDCLVEPGWVETLAGAHEDYDGFGVLGCWRFQDEDFLPEIAGPKIVEYPGGHAILQSLWVQGSSYVLPRRRVQQHGSLRPGESFTQYCKRLAVAGYANGWYFPFVREDHMDDPRSPNTMIRTDADLAARLPLTAQRLGINTVSGWEAEIRRNARAVQEAAFDPGRYKGVKRRVYNLGRRLRRSIRS